MKIEWSTHSIERGESRMITRGEIMCAVLYGEKEKAKTNTTFQYTYKDFRIIVAEHGPKMVIVSCKYTTQFTNRVKRYAKKNNMGFYKSLAILRSSCVA